MKKPTTKEMELALAFHYGARQQIIVPCVNWGFDIGHECDLLVVTDSGYATEIEIKISRSDLIRDKEKYHGHKSPKLKYLYFAIPEHLEKDIEHIPEKAGIYVVWWWEKAGDWRVKLKRPPQKLGKYKFNESKKSELYRLGYLRFWSDRHRIVELKNTVKELETELKKCRKEISKQNEV